MLRNFLLEDHNSMVFTPATLYGKTASALNAFVKTRKLGVLKPSQTELFPIPVMAVLGK
jgi:hypothetical protein